MRKAMEDALLEFKQAALKLEEEWEKLDYDSHWALYPKYPFKQPDYTSAVKSICVWVDLAVSKS